MNFLQKKHDILLQETHFCYGLRWYFFVSLFEVLTAYITLESRLTVHDRSYYKNTTNSSA